MRTRIGHVSAAPGGDVPPTDFAAIVAREDTDMSAKLDLGTSSRIFVIGTEGATDPELYHQLLSQ
jgi:diaminopropionate ammonia-lyase